MKLENRSVREADGLMPLLRDDLIFSVQGEGAARVCVIEDPAAAKFHRVGLDELRFLRSLDGTRTVATILAQLARHQRGESFSEAEAISILRWCQDQHLLAAEGSDKLAEREQKARLMRGAMTWINPLVVRTPLARPDAFFARVEPWFRPAMGRAGFAVWLLVIVVGLSHVGMNWRQFIAESAGVFGRDNWLWLFLVWIGLKVIHEFGHGLYCKHFGAGVREIGVIFITFIPMGYVDATASIGLASKWRRVMVAFAGLYVEFFVAALAAIVWARTEPGTLNTMAHNAVITGSVLTLFFNANPLMRFDGYYILSDLAEIPNLAQRGRQWVQRAWAWLLTGIKRLRPARPESGEEWFVAAYGAAAWAWQILVLGGLLIGASVALRGGGLLFAAIAAAAWVVWPLTNFFTMLARVTGPEHRWPVLMRGAAIVALTIGAMLFPYHRTVSAPAVIELADTQILRAECPGFAAEIFVSEGDAVQAGQTLMVLKNHEAEAQLAASRVQLASQEARARLAYTRSEPAAYLAEQAKVESLQKAVANHESYAATLTVRAPFAGRVTTRQRVEMLRGRYFQPGEELLRIGRGDAFDFKAAIGQSDEPHFRSAINKALSVRVAGRATVLPGTLARVEGSATREVMHPELTALAGGPLAVRRNETPVRNQQAAAYELAEPVFIATARVESGASFLPGESAFVRLRSTRSTTLWEELRRAFDGWRKRHVEIAG